jgi:hypothetical protein
VIQPIARPRQYRVLLHYGRICALLGSHTSARRTVLVEPLEGFIRSADGGDLVEKQDALITLLVSSSHPEKLAHAPAEETAG